MDSKMQLSLLKGDDVKGIEGQLLFYDNNEAYIISTNKQKEVYIKEVDINSQVCIIKSTSPVLKGQKK